MGNTGSNVICVYNNNWLNQDDVISIERTIRLVQIQLRSGRMADVEVVKPRIVILDLVSILSLAEKQLFTIEKSLIFLIFVLQNDDDLCLYCYLKNYFKCQSLFYNLSSKSNNH